MVSDSRSLSRPATWQSRCKACLAYTVLLLAVACGGGNTDGGSSGGGGSSGTGAAGGMGAASGSSGASGAFTFGEPVVLAGSLRFSVRIAQDDASLYVANRGDFDKGNGSIIKLAKGGGAPQTLAANRESPLGIAVVASSVYWLESNAAGGVFVAANGRAPTTLATGISYPVALAADDQHVAWAWGLEQNSVIVQNISDMSVVQQLMNTQRSVSELLFDAPRNQIIVVDRGGTSTNSTNVGTVQAYSLDDGRTTPLTPSLGTLEGAAIHGSRVFFALPDDGQVGSVDLDKQTAQVVAEGLSQPWGIAVDDEYVYVTERFGSPSNCTDSVGTLKAFPITGGEPTVLATGLACPSRIVTDSSAVYWVNNGTSDTATGSVMKIDKQPQ